MRNLSLSFLAAGAAMLSSGALAQAGPPAPPPGHGMPGGMTMHRMGPMPGQNFQRRLQRGFVVPRFFWGPQFQINNWQMYGFADPGPDGRWIRYYDDAYLIDHDGRIRDSREGLDWDRYGEQWDMADGIPAYRGSRDYRPGREDEEWAEEHEGRERRPYAPSARWARCARCTCAAAARPWAPLLWRRLYPGLWRWRRLRRLCLSDRDRDGDHDRRRPGL